MFKKLRKAALLLPIALVCAGCSSKYEPRESIVDEAKAQQKPKITAPQSVQERRAYEKGVQDVLIDMKGKMRARDRALPGRPRSLSAASRFQGVS